MYLENHSVCSVKNGRTRKSGAIRPVRGCSKRHDGELVRPQGGGNRNAEKSDSKDT